jgi:two-component system cell cycle response regulator
MARVLVVDDDEGIVTFVIDLLASEGHEARGSLGEAALRLAAEWRPEVILLDLMMPGIDGFAFHQRLLADPRTRSIPVVVMSADYLLREHRAHLPAQGFLAKPFDIVDLLDWVERLARNRLTPVPHDGGRHRGDDEMGADGRG